MTLSLEPSSLHSVAKYLVLFTVVRYGSLVMVLIYQYDVLCSLYLVFRIKHVNVLQCWWQRDICGWCVTFLGIVLVHRNSSPICVLSSVHWNLIAALYRTLMFTTVFTTASHMGPVYSLQSYFFNIQFSAVLPSTFRFSKRLFPSRLATKTVYTYVLCHACHMPSRSHFS